MLTFTQKHGDHVTVTHSQRRKRHIRHIHTHTHSRTHISPAQPFQECFAWPHLQTTSNHHHHQYELPIVVDNTRINIRKFLAHTHTQIHIIPNSTKSYSHEFYRCEIASKNKCSNKIALRSKQLSIIHIDSIRLPMWLSWCCPSAKHFWRRKKKYPNTTPPR